MRILPIAAALLALSACQQKAAQQSAANETASSEAGPHKGIDRSHKGEVAPGGIFNDPDGKPISIAAFKGKPALVNLWATWCAPCVKELPTLDRLDAGGAVHVVAVSQDGGPHPSVVAFLKEHQIATLKPYQDAKMTLSGALGPDTVLPTSILIGADGKEVWRYVGDLDWTSPEAAKLLAEAGAAPQKG